jgi:uncharacterized membrane protein (UPF0127 family)
MAVMFAVALVAIIAVAYSLMDDDDTFDHEATVGFHLADGGYLNFSCEVADDYIERTEGLQNREDLAIDAGMLFIYDPPEKVTFIMINMNFPLDMVFIAGNGTVVNVEEADVEDPDTPSSDLIRYRSDGEVMYVLEINQGLCEKYGIGPGTRVDIVFPK